jgi:hypothetical protein
VPSFANDTDRFTVETIRRWLETAQNQIGHIEAWRASNHRMTAGDWPRKPDRFFGQTAILVSWITLHHPRLNPAPLLDINECIRAWHTDYTEERVPEQPALEALLDRAIIVLNSARFAIESRMVKTPPDNGTPASGEAPGAEEYVTLDQAAAQAGRNKRTLERWSEKTPMPDPDVEGGGGKPNEWRWSRIRPWLEQRSGRKLPEHFPRLR